MNRILIADDHALLRTGLKLILHEEYPDAFIDEAENGELVIKKCTDSNGKWNIIICDVSMPVKSGWDVLRFLKKSYPTLPVLMLSVYPENQYAIRLLKAGAAGYLCKQAANDELIMAVKKILGGGKYISSSIAELLAYKLDQTSDKTTHEVLSDLEFNIFKYLALGKKSAQIADLLSIRASTVRNYKVKILTKMNMKTDAEITRYAMENDLI